VKWERGKDKPPGTVGVQWRALSVSDGRQVESGKGKREGGMRVLCSLDSLYSQGSSRNDGYSQFFESFVPFVVPSFLGDLVL